MLPRIAGGATRVLGIVGDPIAQVRSPPLWSALFRHNGMNAVCVPFHVHAPALPAFVDGPRDAQNPIGLDFIRALEAGGNASRAAPSARLAPARARS